MGHPSINPRSAARLDRLLIRLFWSICAILFEDPQCREERLQSQQYATEAEHSVKKRFHLQTQQFTALRFTSPIQSPETIDGNGRSFAKNCERMQTRLYIAHPESDSGADSSKPVLNTASSHAFCGINEREFATRSDNALRAILR